MGKLQKLEIHFLNCSYGSPVFYAGQTISGQVIVELNEPMKMRGIRATFTGGANVHWTESRTQSSGKSTTTTTDSYTNCEPYFNQTVTLYGKEEGDSGDNPTLDPGLHTFNFQLILPMNLPSSFEGIYGRVRYFITGVIDRPWKFNHTIKAAFTVVTNLDLNTRQNSALGVDANDQKFVCCLCCKSGPISCRAAIPRSGYVPGQKIPVRIEIQNNTNRRCNYSQAVLKCHIHYHATTKTRTETKDVCIVRGGEITGRHGDSWIAEVLVPSTPPSELIYCSIIDIEYAVEVHVSPSGPALDLKLGLPVVIGTIPLREMFSSFAFPAQQHQLTGPLPPGFENYPDAPPPSYSETFSGPVNIKGEDDTDYTMGNLNYAPVYPYFGIQ